MNQWRKSEIIFITTQVAFHIFLSPEFVIKQWLLQLQLFVLSLFAGCDLCHIIHYRHHFPMKILFSYISIMVQCPWNDFTLVDCEKGSNKHLYAMFHFYISTLFEFRVITTKISMMRRIMTSLTDCMQWVFVMLRRRRLGIF